MHLNDYMHEAMGFRLPSADRNYAVLNLAGEVGEFMSVQAKFIRDGGDPAVVREKSKKELGDVLWCLTAVAKDLGFTLEEVARANIEKLRNRQTNNTIHGNGDDR